MIHLILTYWWLFLLAGLWSIALAAWSWWARGDFEKRHRRNLLAERRNYIKRV